MKMLSQHSYLYAHYPLSASASDHIGRPPPPPAALQSGNILRRAQLYEEEVRSKRRNIALLQVVKAVSNADENVDVVIRQVMTTSQQTLNCHRVSLFQVIIIFECAH